MSLSKRQRIKGTSCYAWLGPQRHCGTAAVVHVLAWCPPLPPPCMPAQACLKYELPSCPGVLVDVKGDSDVANMWEELAEWAAAAQRPAYKLHVYVDHFIHASDTETNPDRCASVCMQACACGMRHVAECTACRPLAASGADCKQGALGRAAPCNICSVSPSPCMLLPMACTRIVYAVFCLGRQAHACMHACMHAARDPPSPWACATRPRRCPSRPPSSPRPTSAACSRRRRRRGMVQQAAERAHTPPQQRQKAMQQGPPTMQPRPGWMLLRPAARL